MANADASYLALILRGAERLGFPGDELCRTVGLDPAVASRPDARVPSAGVYALLDELRRRTGDPFVGLALGREEAAAAGAVGVVAFACRTSPTIAAAFGKLRRYSILVDAAKSLESRIDAEGRLVVGYRRRSPAGALLPPTAAQFALSLLFWSGRRLTDVPFRPLAVRLVEPGLDDASAASTYFEGAPVELSAGAQELVLPAEIAAYPLAQPDPALLAVLEGIASKALIELAADSASDQLRGVLLERLASSPQLADAAPLLGMSARTLQRRLREEGTTFQAVLDGVRRSLALRYLERAELSIAEIAMLLGYTDAPQFARAFRRWTGHAPRELKPRGR